MSISAVVGAGFPLAQAVADIRRDIHMREQGVMLEHHVDRAAIGGNADHRLPGDLDRTAIGLLEAGDQAQGCGLAAARWPQEGMERAALQAEADIVDRVDVAKMFDDRAELDVDSPSPDLRQSGLCVGATNSRTP